MNQLAGDHVDLLTMIPEGHVVETAQPGPRKLFRSRQADLHFIVGHPALFFESRYVNPLLKPASQVEWVSMYEVAKNMRPARILKDTDPHLWTSLSIMQASARVIADNLSRLDPENSDSYRKNFLKLNKLLNDLDKQIRKEVVQSHTGEFLVYHPAWGHFSQDYGLHQLAIEKQGKAPDLARLSSIFRTVDENNINFIISSPGADQRQAGIIAAQLQIDVQIVDPMDPDWIHMMRNMREAIRK